MEEPGAEQETFHGLSLQIGSVGPISQTHLCFCSGSPNLQGQGLGCLPPPKHCFTRGL